MVCWAVQELLKHRMIVDCVAIAHVATDNPYHEEAHSLMAIVRVLWLIIEVLARIGLCI